MLKTSGYVINDFCNTLIKLNMYSDWLTSDLVFYWEWKRYE